MNTALQPSIPLRTATHWLTLGSGALLLLVAATRRTTGGAWIAVSSAPLLYRGITGRWPVGRYTDDTRSALAGNAGVNVRESIRLERPIDEVRRFKQVLEAGESPRATA